MSDLEGKPLSGAERLAWLRLALSQNIGPITFRQLVVMYGSAVKALEAIPELAQRGGSTRRIKLFSKERAEEIFSEIDGMNAFAVFLGDEIYPKPLTAIEDAPPFLVGRGSRLAPETPVPTVSAFHGTLLLPLGPMDILLLRAWHAALIPMPTWEALRPEP